jgi:hypothetical protein
MNEKAYVVMIGAEVRATFTGSEAIDAATRFAGQLAASSADDPQDIARSHGIWIAGPVDLNPPS